LIYNHFTVLPAFDLFLFRRWLEDLPGTVFCKQLFHKCTAYHVRLCALS